MAKDESPAGSPAPEAGTATPPAQKRTAPAEATESAPRTKRGKYTSLACNECKRRKLKCLPNADGSGCERCNARKLMCIFAVNSPKADKKRDEGSQTQIQVLSDELAQVREDIANLSQVVLELKQQRSPYAVQGLISSHTDPSSTRSPSNAAARDTAPKLPQFIGPTRPSYGLMIAERSLTRMGIPGSPSSPSASAPASPSPEPPSATAAAPAATDLEFWAQCTPAELVRLIGVFEDEVESVYPYIDSTEFTVNAERILRILRQPELLEEEGSIASGMGRRLTATDIDIAKIAVAIGIVIEARGKSDLGTAIVASVEQHATRVSQSTVTLRGIQLMITLSVYYFHSDNELLAWRAIGVAAREAIEIGLHRKKSLCDNFTDAISRQTALRVFCCCYILDRRWSFGTSLSFSLVDGDIDPDLLQIELGSPYLKCMFGYARLCSKLWEAIPQFGAPNQPIPDDVAYALDASTLKWFDSIPPHLQLRNPSHGNDDAGSLGPSMRSQHPRALQRLRALLYFRGNLTRISIYQHHLISPAAVEADPQRARVAVDLARDTVQVLVHLNATSDIYSRQQNAFNYFLASAFAVISLALCHAPNLFAAPCTQSFMDAARLVKGFSQHSMASKRLWKSIRKLSPRLQSLGAGRGANTSTKEQSSGSSRGSAVGSESMAPRWSGYSPAYGDDGRQPISSSQPIPPSDGLWNYNLNPTTMGGTPVVAGNTAEPLPGMNPDILSLFDSLGDQAMFSSGTFDPNVYGGMEPDGNGSDYARIFLQGLM